MPVLLRGYRERGRGVLGSRSNRGPGVSSYRNARRTGAGEHRVTARDLSETGNCYVVAFQYMLEHPSQEGLLLCHGLVYGQGRMEGLRFGHAWNEIGDVVIDNSNGVYFEGSKSEYYRIGKIDPKDVRCYTAKEAFELGLKYRHYGPWDPAVEGVYDAVTGERLDE